ncbi:D-xylose-proton symporter-like 2 isoform X2 [Cucumis melo var. makuwa]|uniref:D-xylose-proton symporter-like 2 isoform X2 n=1 Tax=Cucumis melo var. makuwa TaxID=1194695 RepID=A0A5A7VHK2_CUCMM|nr:D-xylose-proton symporter-like 2 isoform X2 [Cucumis melo var. makuwa]
MPSRVLHLQISHGPNQTKFTHRLKIACLLGILCTNEAINASTHLHVRENVSEGSNCILPLESTCPIVVTLPDRSPHSKNDGSEVAVLEDMGGQDNINGVIIDRENRIDENEGYNRGHFDHTLFTKVSKARKIAVLIVYVDDIVLTGYDTDEIVQLNKKMGSREGILVSQRKYTLDLLAETSILRCRPAVTPIEFNAKLGNSGDRVPVDKEKYQHLMEKLIYLSHTRPDISYVVSIVNQFIKSTSRYYTFVWGNLVTWRSKKQEAVARSNAKAEYKPMSLGICEEIWLQKMLSNLCQDLEVPMKLFCDNKAAISVANNPVQHDRTKHVEIDKHFIKEKLDYVSIIEWNIMTSGSLYGALIGSVLAFNVADFLGRRRELILSALMYLVGAIITGLAPNFAILIIGRFISGTGIGLAMHAAPMYIAETSPSKIRGQMISLKEFFIVLGMVFGYSIGSLLVEVVAGWRYIYAANTAIASVMGVGMWWLPSSPRWLLLCAIQRKGNMAELKEQAISCLHRLRGAVIGEKASEEVDEILEELSFLGESEEASIGEIFQGKCLKALIIGAGLVLFQQITGQPSVLYYAPSIFQSAGFSAAADATRVSILLGLLKLLMTGAAVLVVDRLGRRPLLLGGVFGIVISLFLLGSYYLFLGNVPAVAVVALLLYVGSYQDLEPSFHLDPKF